jgi:Tol biopolymer transport system component
MTTRPLLLVLVLLLALELGLLAGCGGPQKPMAKVRGPASSSAEGTGRKAPDQKRRGEPNSKAAPGLARVVTIKKNGGRVDWSPSGNLIAFDSKGSDGYYDVYVMLPNGSNERCITCNRPALPGKHTGNPAWHPNGKWIVFQAEKKDHPGGSLGALPGLGKHSDLWLASSDGARFFQLTDLPNTRGSGVLHPHFSRDGGKLSWSEMVEEPRPFKPRRGYGTWRLKVADFSFVGGKPTLDNMRAYQPGGPAFYENHGFSPDGSKLLFTSNFDGGPTLRDNKIYVLNLSDGSARMLTDNDVYNEHASFSPDGTKILWGSSLGNANKGMDWWLMDSDGSNKRKLSRFNDPESAGFGGFSAAVDHSWSPKGDQIVGYVQDSIVRQTGKIVVATLGKD